MESDSNGRTEPTLSRAGLVRSIAHEARALVARVAPATDRLASVADTRLHGSTPQIISGIITEISPSHVVLAVRDRVHLAHIEPHAQFWQRGPCQLDDLHPGDAISAQGSWREGAFVATHLICDDDAFTVA